MKVLKTGTSYVIRLLKGEEMITSLLEFAKAYNCESGFFHGLGGAMNASLGIYQIDTDNEYHFTDFSGPLEIVSLNGNISTGENGEITVHCHSVITGSDLHAYGGHVQRMEIAGTCEIYVQQVLPGLHRKFDDQTKLNLLDIDG